MTTSAFLETLSPLHRGRAGKVLATQTRVNGDRVLSRAELISERISLGSKINTVRGERVLEMPNGVFLSQKSITSIGMDYAAFLLGAA